MTMHMNAEVLQKTAYTQITFADGTKAILTFEPSVRGRTLWSERLVSHPFPSIPSILDMMFQRKKSVITKCWPAPPETAIGKLLRCKRPTSMFGLYRHDLQQELYELACPWYTGGSDSARAALRIKDIGRQLYDMGEDAVLLQDQDADVSGIAVYMRSLTHFNDNRGMLPEGFSSQAHLTNARRWHEGGHAAMVLHFIALGVLAGVYDEVTTTVVPAARHNFPKTKGGIVEMHHTKHFRGDLEITGWQCVVEMLWHGIGQWEN